MGNENQNLEEMRGAAEFVLKHHGMIRQALIGEALALEEQAETLRELAEQGGCGLMTPQSATETAKRKEGEARSIRTAQTELEKIARGL